MKTALIGFALWLVVCDGVRGRRRLSFIEIDGAIGPATATYISRSIGEARTQNAQCLIIQLDTPGGLLDSTQDIVQRFYASPVPTVVYVSLLPARGRTASRAFITLAADVAAMAPNTSIGAAHPVSIPGMGGGAEKNTDDVMKKKMENYASMTFIESIADRRHRNVEWARSAVVDSKATTGRKKHSTSTSLISIAKDVPDLLQTTRWPHRRRQDVEHRE